MSVNGQAAARAEDGGIAAAMRLVRDLAASNAALERVGFVKAPECEPAGVYFERQPDGTMARRWAETPGRVFRCWSIAAICEVVRAFAPGEEGGTAPHVYVGREGVVARLDEGGRREETATMRFTPTPQFAALATLSGDEPLDQESLVWLLRTALASSIVDPSFLPLIRKVRFRASTEGQADIAVGREQIGRAVLNELAGIDGGAMPETVTFTVPVYDEVLADVRLGRHLESVTLAMRVDIVRQRFGFRDVGSSLALAAEGARRAATVMLRERLDGVAVVIEETEPVS